MRGLVTLTNQVGKVYTTPEGLQVSVRPPGGSNKIVRGTCVKLKYGQEGQARQANGVVVTAYGSTLKVDVR